MLILAESRELDRKALIVMVTAALSLTLLNYGNLPWALEKCLQGLCRLGLNTWAAEGLDTLASWDGDSFAQLAWWSLTCLTAYFVLPALVIRLVLRERLRDYGLKLTGAFTGLPIYLGMLAVVLPLVVLVSAEARFQSTYPFYPVSSRGGLGPRFWCWELLYAGQFVALEFFFRGFLVQGTRHCFGVNSILLMVVPYCMIHFGKPVLETLAAIIAGLALGLMSYRTRSIWMGAVLHVTVAWTMDLTVLYRRGIYP